MNHSNFDGTHGYTTTYTYDTDATCGTHSGDKVKRLDPAGNVSCYNYDGLHRLKGITSPTEPTGAVTLYKYFTYDVPQPDDIGFSLTNPKGHLVERHTYQPGVTCCVSADLFGYSARGEATDPTS